jgi:hypothetical protein
MANNAQTTTATALTTASTSVTVQAGKGALFASNQYATLYAAGVIELVLIGTIAGDVLPVTRAQGGTTAAAWASGSTILQGANATSLTSMMNSAITTFRTSATMQGYTRAAFDPSADLHPVRWSWADANYYPSSQPYQPALSYVPIQQGWDTTHAVALGWSGSFPYLVIDGVYKGMLYHSGNLNAAAIAANGAPCNWNSGIVEFGQANPGVPGNGSSSSATIDVGNPWLCEGMRQANGSFWPYVRAVWLRNN